MLKLIAIAGLLVSGHAYAAECPKLTPEHSNSNEPNLDLIVEKINELNAHRLEPHCLTFTVENPTDWSKITIEIKDSKDITISEFMPKPILYKKEFAYEDSVFEYFFYVDGYRKMNGNIVVKAKQFFGQSLELVAKNEKNDDIFRPYVPMTFLSCGDHSSERSKHKAKISDYASQKGIAYLAHSTPCDNLVGILKSGKIESAKLGHKDTSSYTDENVIARNYVFLGLVSSNQLAEEVQMSIGDAKKLRDCTLYLSLEKLDHGKYHINPEWRYGKLGDDTVKADDLDKMRKLIDIWTGNVNVDNKGIRENEVVFPESVSLKYLAKIRVPKIRVPKSRADIINAVKELDCQIKD